MALTIKDNHFYDTEKDRALSVHAKQTRAGRWQFRTGDAKGKLIASGVTPAQFAKQFWFRDDFTEDVS